ncbi:MAG: hypothetical protein V7727_21770 [Sneathiella sp.]
MPKDLTPQMEAELAKERKRPIYFLEGEFDDGPLRLCTGMGRFQWDGKEWLGSSDLLGISNIPDHVAMASHKMTISLNGLRLENIGLALDQVTQGSPVRIWSGYLDADFAIIPDPYLAFVGQMNEPIIEEPGDTVNLSITVDGVSAELLDVKERRRTHEDQQIKFPGDKGLEYVIELQENETPWG